MLATRAPDGGLPAGEPWTFEVKWDGVRALVSAGDGAVRVHGRRGTLLTAAWPELAALGDLPGVLLDGEVVVMADGTPSFGALAERMHVRDAASARRLAGSHPATYVAFDVLVLRGEEVLRLPLADRRSALATLDLTAPAVLSPVHTDGGALWAATREHGLEGVVAKRRDSPYQPGRRSPDWVKATHRRTRAAAVVGWRPETSSARLGSVLLAAPDDGGVWRYLGRAGSGLAGRRGESLLGVLAALPVGSSPADDVPAADARGARWCRPEVVVDVEYLQRTRHGRLRHPVVRGVRTDVPPDPWDAA